MLFGDVSMYVVAYMDDLVVFSMIWEDHLCYLDETLSRLTQADLSLKISKYQFAIYQCLYLDHVIGKGPVIPDEAKVVAVKDFMIPSKKKDVRSFLGFAGYEVHPQLCHNCSASDQERPPRCCFVDGPRTGSI